MNNNNQYESMLWKLLEKERLADLAQFHKPRYCEEVPFYSRLNDVSFLTELGQAAANAILLQFALKFLKSVISYEAHRTPYFAAITIRHFSEDDPFVPNLFFCSDSIRKLRDRLALQAVKEPFSKQIKRLVSQLRLHEPMDVYEDVVTTPNVTPVFIGPLLPPYPSFVPLYTFHRPAVSAK